MIGPVLLFGSGETSPNGRKAFELAFRYLSEHRPKDEPPKVALLETPAGFELNSFQVIGRVANFLEERLQNYKPQTTIIRARKRGTSLSPDDQEVAAPILTSDMIFLGPGSPTYAVRQLKDSLTWQAVQYCHREGAVLALASAAVLSISSYTLPVYEIYKVGEDLHWMEGLDFFRPFGLNTAFIPHWNNTDGGEELDTSRCFMGVERFEKLISMLPPETVITGIGENTALWIDPQACICEVAGIGEVVVLREGKETHFQAGEKFPFEVLRSCNEPEPLPDALLSQVDGMIESSKKEDGEGQTPEPTGELLDLVKQREDARKRRDWKEADQLRDQVTDQGWKITDTPDGPKLEKNK